MINKINNIINFKMYYIIKLNNTQLLYHQINNYSMSKKYINKQTTLNSNSIRNKLKKI